MNVLGLVEALVALTVSLVYIGAVVARPVHMFRREQREQRETLSDLCDVLLELVDEMGTWPGAAVRRLRARQRRAEEQAAG